MKVEEMALRSEIRQMLNEAGFNRDIIKQMVQDSINDIVKNQVNQVLMERREKDLGEVVEDYISNRLQRQIQNCAADVIKHKLQWMDIKVNVQVNNKTEDENKKVCPNNK